MPRKLTILLDLDSTLAELDKAWYGRYNAKFNDDLCMERVHSWDTHLYAKAGKAVYSVLSEPGLYRDLPVLPGAKGAVQAFAAAGHRLVVASACPKNSCDDKVAWVKKHFPEIDSKDIILGSSKELLFADVMIDDGPHNLRDYRAAWGHYPLLCTISYPYNQDARGVADLFAEDWRNTAVAWSQIVGEVDYFANQDITRNFPKKLDHGVGLEALS